MKYITFAIPSYNSEAYLHHAVDSLLHLGEDVEIIIVNDGSTDRTLDIALDYQSKYQHMIKVIDKKNGGHGSGVNEGLKHATGLYYKVVDSDDWLDEKNTVALLNTIKGHVSKDKMPDLYITDFVYEHVEDDTHFVRSYRENYPAYQHFSWAETRQKFKYSSTLLMHALLYKTSVLRESKLELPEHTFYVDNVFAYIPLPHVKTIFYMPIVIYHYYIGRIDQSINLDNIVKRYENQIRVMYMLMNAYSYEEVKKQPKGLRDYMKHFLGAMMIITQMFTIGKDTKERRIAIKKLWKDLKALDIKLYRKLRYRSYNIVVNFLPYRLRGFVMLTGYKYFRKRVKLG